ncbi:heavy metal transport/detoxification protein [Acrocarpospora phusangensis]|uniref:Heavy metal transport/detoxification protein n=1 Tax=Acrocarpospora phusangensis TaxID=1070424 RepID=A0A919Q7J1_9ACTN|nr:heavy-metal-associated domain-containing protein [Acrocarpospora phusangensis]GIH23636.1 heavy metal transport/detoxification protein [Acrocarpospora phusangensis]
MNAQIFQVTGMNCGHCADSVTKSVTAVAGVDEVTVDLPTGRLTVSGQGPVDEDGVRRAVTEAGFAVA